MCRGARRRHLWRGVRHDVTWKRAMDKIVPERKWQWNDGVWCWGVQREVVHSAEKDSYRKDRINCVDCIVRGCVIRTVDHKSTDFRQWSGALQVGRPSEGLRDLLKVRPTTRTSVNVRRHTVCLTTRAWRWTRNTILRSLTLERDQHARRWIRHTRYKDTKTSLQETSRWRYPFAHHSSGRCYVQSEHVRVQEIHVWPPDYDVPETRSDVDNDEVRLK